MTAQDSGPDALRTLLEQGGEDDVRAYLGLFTPPELVDVMVALPEDLRPAAFSALDTRTRVDLVARSTDAQVCGLVSSLPPQLAGDLLEALDEDLRRRVFGLLDLPHQASVLREVEQESAREDLIESIADGDLADIVEQQLTDDATDLVEEIPEDRRGRVLDAMEEGRRAEIEQLSAYPGESAGGLMQTELVRLHQDLTVLEATNLIRQEYARLGDLYDLYVVDSDGRLQGRVRSRQLLVNRPQTPIREFMLADLQSVPVTMDQEEIADIVKDYDLSSVPVVDGEGRLLGRILVDDILDVVEEEFTEDAAKQAGTTAEDVYSRSVVRTIRARVPWLLATFGGGLLTVFLVMKWEHALVEDISLLAAAIPIIMGMSGNIGIQASTVTVRSLAVGEIDLTRLGRVIGKEMVSGCVFALLFGLLLFLAIRYVIAPITGFAWPAAYRPELVVLIPTVAFVLTIATASAIGTLVPLTLHRLGKDPAVASSPFITTTADVVAISLLVLVKRILL